MDAPPPSFSHFGFLTLRRFSMIAFANALEPLRMANYLSGRELYRWSVYSLDGEPVPASNGLSVSSPKQIDETALPDILFVCAGLDVAQAVDEHVLRLLRRLAKRRLPLGGLCTGAYALAKAGLLEGHRCAIHWESLWALRETFPRIVFTPELFAIDRDRYTCTGGIAPLELVLHLITPRIGRTLAAGICEEFILARIRDSKDHQHIPLATRLGGGNPSIAQAAQLMEANIEEPLSLQQLAQLAEVSQRQLQRLFRRTLGITPAQYYATVRLYHARALLRQTAMPVMDITVACGFRSSCHFSRSYRSLFGHPPSQERRLSPSTSNGHADPRGEHGPGNAMTK